MFPSRYFADRMFAPRYFPKVGSSVALIEGPGVWTAAQLYSLRVVAGQTFSPNAKAGQAYHPEFNAGQLGHN